MTESTTPNASAAAAAVEPAAVNPIAQSGARWFWWIAGLSLINTVLIHTGSDLSFVVGLGITLMADIIFANERLIGFAIDAIVLGFFF